MRLRNKAYFFLFALLVLSKTIAFAGGPKNITGVDRAKLIQALYKHAKVQGFGRFQNEGNEISLEEAASLVGKRIEYLHGKVMKIMIPSEKEGNEINTGGYNHDNGENAAEKIVDAVSRNEIQSSTPGPSLLNINDPVILHNGAIESKAVVDVVLMEILNLANSFDFRDQIALYELIEKSRNKSHVIFGSSAGSNPNLGPIAQNLMMRGLLNAIGDDVKDIIRNVILSAVIGQVGEDNYNIRLPYDPGNCADLLNGNKN